MLSVIMRLTVIIIIDIININIFKNITIEIY